MKRKMLSCAMAVLVMLPILLKMGVLVHFYANQAYIANYLCENRDKIGSNCEGSCVLSARFKQFERQRGHMPLEQKRVLQLEVDVFALDRQEVLLERADESRVKGNYQTRHYPTPIIPIGTPPPDRAIS